MFDILASGQQSLCHVPYRERRIKLVELLEAWNSNNASKSFVQLAESFDIVKTEDEVELEKNIDSLQRKAINAGCEGIIVKSGDSLYETAGTRSTSWVKLKHMNLAPGQYTEQTESTSANIRDTLDLIPIGAFWGKGNRTGLYGSYLMGTYNINRNCFESICKLGTGFSFA